MDAAILGLIVADVLASPMDLRRPPAPGGLAILHSLTLHSGGNACNTAIAMTRLGMRTAAAGLIGNDILGNAILEKLKSQGVDSSAVFRTDAAQTSATVVAVAPEGERSFFHTPGATALLDADVFRRCLPVFKQCAFVQVGYFGLLPALTPQLPTLLDELKAASPGTKVALDTCNPPADWDLFEPILPHLDVLAPSRPEAAALTGEASPERMVERFRRHMPPRSLIGIKLDADGCYLDDGNRAVFVPAYEVQVVDTTGAGDTWYAGLLTALRRGMPLDQAGRLANRAAADCCTALGASAGVRSFDETFARI